MRRCGQTLQHFFKKKRNLIGAPLKPAESPTCSQLHPAADLVHGPGAAEEEEREAADAGEDQRHGRADEEGGGLERAGGDGAELGEAALAGQVPGQPVPDAVVEQTEVARLRGVRAVADPVRLDEAHHVDDGEEDGEDGPEDADGAGVPHVVGLVDFGRLGGGQHGGGRAGGPRDHAPVWVKVGPGVGMGGWGGIDGPVPQQTNIRRI